jgi:hypothetical protein
MIEWACSLNEAYRNLWAYKFKQRKFVKNGQLEQKGVDGRII